MKYTIFITQECNLNCLYCYINKRPLTMTLDMAQKIVDFIYLHTPDGEKIEIGFFGGEPLLEFERIKEVVSIIENHISYRRFPLEISVVTNGTIFTEGIAEFLNEHHIGFCLSCDGPSQVQDISRRFKNGTSSSSIVENTIRQASILLPSVLVNAVITPSTVTLLPQTVEYFANLGLRNIYLNPDFSAPWTKEAAGKIEEIYERIGEIYIDSYRKDKPLFISLLDGKIAIILRGGYQPEERCQMGKKEFAFTPEGNVFPCERLVGDGAADNPHCIGQVDKTVQLQSLNCQKYSAQINSECLDCDLQDYCMNWCGCSNFMSSGYYNRVGPFLCASERASIQVALKVFQTLEAEFGSLFYEHMSGKPILNSLV